MKRLLFIIIITMLMLTACANNLTMNNETISIKEDTDHIKDIVPVDTPETAIVKDEYSDNVTVLVVLNDYEEYSNVVIPLIDNLIESADNYGYKVETAYYDTNASTMEISCKINAWADINYGKKVVLFSHDMGDGYLDELTKLLHDDIIIGGLGFFMHDLMLFYEMENDDANHNLADFMDFQVAYDSNNFYQNIAAYLKTNLKKDYGKVIFLSETNIRDDFPGVTSFKNIINSSVSENIEITCAQYLVGNEIDESDYYDEVFTDDVVAVVLEGYLGLDVSASQELAEELSEAGFEDVFIFCQIIERNVGLDNNQKIVNYSYSYKKGADAIVKQISEVLDGKKQAHKCLLEWELIE